MLDDTSFYTLLQEHHNRAYENYRPVCTIISEYFPQDEELLYVEHDYSCTDYVHYDDVMEVAKRTANKFDLYAGENEFSIQGIWYIVVWTIEERLHEGDYEDAGEYEVVSERHNFLAIFGEENELISLEAL